MVRDKEFESGSLGPKIQVFDHGAALSVGPVQQRNKTYVLEGEANLLSKPGGPC